MVNVAVRSNSIILIEGQPRTGKTQIAKNIYTSLQNRYIITFDYSGEHALSKFPNCFSNSVNWDNYLPHLYNITDLGFDISDYWNKGDWKSVGMSDGASEIVSMIARCKSAHNNDWYVFKEILSDFPFGGGYTSAFSNKWGIKLKAPVHFETYKNVQKVITSIEQFFIEDYNTYDIPYLLRRYRHININLQLNKGNLFTQRAKARLLVGKVLEKLVPYLKEFKPVIVFEEADILIPKLKAEDEYFSSWDWIKQYILKLGLRYGCMLMFIVQDVNNCDDDVRNMFNYMVRYEFTIPFQDRGVFSFAVKGNESSPYRTFFKPYDASSQFENYPVIDTNDRKLFIE